MAFKKRPRKHISYIKQLRALACLLVGGVIGFSLAQQYRAEPAAPVGIRTMQVRFSPKGGCTQLITRAIEEAEREIYMFAFSFTSARIANALLAAKARGVKIHIIVDHREYTRGQAPQIDRLKNKVDYLVVDTRKSYAHNKVVVIDRRTVVTGSFNFDKNAEEKNRENVLCIKNDPVLAKKYLENWQKNKQYIEAHQ